MKLHESMSAADLCSAVQDTPVRRDSPAGCFQEAPQDAGVSAMEKDALVRCGAVLPRAETLFRYALVPATLIARISGCLCDPWADLDKSLQSGKGTGTVGSMQIAKDSVVTMHYTLTSPEGTVIDSSREGEPLAYLHGYQNIVPGLESRLEGEKSGSSLNVKVPAREGYGERDPNKVLPAKREQFPAEADVKVGMQFQANSEAGPMVVRVIEIEGDEVKLDANHPLAGVDLDFKIDIVDVREATGEELEHGHVHGPGGHHH